MPHRVAIHRRQRPGAAANVEEAKRGGDTGQEAANHRDDMGAARSAGPLHPCIAAEPLAGSAPPGDELLSTIAAQIGDEGHVLVPEPAPRFPAPASVTASRKDQYHALLSVRSASRKPRQ